MKPVGAATMAEKDEHQAARENKVSLPGGIMEIGGGAGSTGGNVPAGAGLDRGV